MFRTLSPPRARSLLPATDRFSRLIGRMEEGMGNLFDVFSPDGEWTPRTFFVPKADIVESDSGFEVTVDLPGMKREEIDVEVKNGDLWISGKRAEEKEEKGKTYHRIERRTGEFRRVLALPAAVDSDKVSAKYDNGILAVTVPKLEEAKPKRVEVKACPRA